MKKYRILSVVLSLAMVISMTSAFSVSAYAVNDADGAYTPKAPEKVSVAGVELGVGQYIYAEEGAVKSQVAQDDRPNSSKGYAYYNDAGELILHNFKLNGVTESAGIKVDGDPESTYYALDIVLEGENEIIMGEDSDESAIAAEDVNLTISASTGYRDASLTLKSNNGKSEGQPADYNSVCCIRAGSFELLSGTLEITAGTGFYDVGNPERYEDDKNIKCDSAIDSNGGVRIAGGKLDIKKAAIGIYTLYSAVINGGEVYIGTPKTGAGEETEGSITFGGIYCFLSSFVMNGGEAVIQNVRRNENDDNYGILAYESVIVKDGSLTIKDVGESAVETVTGDVNLYGGIVDISGIGHDGFCLNGGNVNFSGGSVSIFSCGGDGFEVNSDEDIYTHITRGGSFFMTGGTLSVTGTQISEEDAGGSRYNSENGISTKDKVSIKNSDVSMKNFTYHGIDAGSEVTITGSDVSVTGTKNEAILSSYNRVDISDSVVNVVSDTFGIRSSSGVTVKNSDVEVLSESKSKTYYALYPSVKVSGNPAVYAGTTKSEAKKIKDLNKIDAYQYVHIYKNSNGLFSRISLAFENLFKALFGAKDGSIFAGLFSGNLISKLFESLF